MNAVRERLVIEGNIFGDLMAINIQRGRDHGLPGYAHYREVLGLGAVNSFDDLSDSFSSEQIARFKDVYKNVKDIGSFSRSHIRAPLCRKRAWRRQYPYYTKADGKVPLW